MKKYSEIAELTKEFLAGTLDKLTVELVNNENLRVSVLYEDSYNFRYDYDIEIVPSSGEFIFLSHNSVHPLNKVALDRVPRFERAVYETLTCES